jgi:hypothetical protein
MSEVILQLDGIVHPNAKAIPDLLFIRFDERLANAEEGVGDRLRR